MQKNIAEERIFLRELWDLTKPAQNYLAKKHFDKAVVLVSQNRIFFIPESDKNFSTNNNMQGAQRLQEFLNYQFSS